jgi:hypothetical protein
MTSKTNFVQHNKKKVVSNNDTTAPQPFVSMQEQGERGHDESLNKAGSVICLCTLGYTRSRKRLPMLKIQVAINAVEIFVATSTHACHNTCWPWITPRVFTARSQVVIWNVTFIVFIPSIVVFAYALTCAMQFYQ